MRAHAPGSFRAVSQHTNSHKIAATMRTGLILSFCLHGPQSLFRAVTIHITLVRLNFEAFLQTLENKCKTKKSTFLASITRWLSGSYAQVPDNHSVTAICVLNGLFFVLFGHKKYYVKFAILFPFNFLFLSFSFLLIIFSNFLCYFLPQKTANSVKSYIYSMFPFLSFSFLSMFLFVSFRVSFFLFLSFRL